MDISKHSDIADIAPRFQNQTPFYEVWYGKVNFENKAFWFRYTLLNGKTKEAALWAIFFNGSHITFRKKIFNLSDLNLNTEIVLPKGMLSVETCWGDLDDVKWQLQFQNQNGSFDHVPTLFKKFSKSLVCTPYLDLSVSGWISAQGQTYSFNHQPGMMGHIWGKKQAQEWTWGHCNAFDNEKNVVFEGVSAKISFLGLPSPKLTSLYLHAHGKTYIFNHFLDLFKTTSSYKRGFWKFKAKNKHILLEGKMQSTSKEIIEIPYTDTDDSRLICHNSKLANLELWVHEFQTNQKYHFVSKHKAALEWVRR